MTNFEGIIGRRSRDEKPESRSGSDNMDGGSGDDQDPADNLQERKESTDTHLANPRTWSLLF
ncbi:hypothetical protein Ddye_019205 [Dipteronia dyeriana]|uniref:Uncharacterized protein n=1 Tax=Dipteronia dyeriana TaxID=168575 RepID=A0AAD9WVT1_9ROSI|nr:hypothetical protein Ddye_019205 [Dipteronia dyeriana]